MDNNEVEVQKVDNQHRPYLPGWYMIDGRGTRSEYWRVVLCVTLPICMILGIASAIFTLNKPISSIPFVFAVSVIGAIFNFFLSTPATVRRFHDLNASGWWYLLFYVLGFVPYVQLVSSLAFFIIVGCIDGTVGPNNYGADPKGRDPNWVRPLQNAIAGTQVSASNPKSVEDRLRELVRLKEAGIVSDAEYEQKRKRLIDEI